MGQVDTRSYEATLKFTDDQIFLTDDEVAAVADHIFVRQGRPSEYTNTDRAFIQACMLLAAYVSDYSSDMFSLYEVFWKNPGKEVTEILKKWAKKCAKRWLDGLRNPNNPKINKIGISAVQIKHGTDWKCRWQGMDDGLTYISQYYIPRP